MSLFDGGIENETEKKILCLRGRDRGVLHRIVVEHIGQSMPVPPARSYGRAEVVSKTGIVATNQVLASQVGAQMLARGGSAVDAAIAANAVLSVLEPMMAGPAQSEAETGALCYQASRATYEPDLQQRRDYSSWSPSVYRCTLTC